MCMVMNCVYSCTGSSFEPSQIPGVKLSSDLATIFTFVFYLFFLFVVNFVIHWNETAMGLHVFPIQIPPSHLPLHPLPLGFPSAPGPNAFLMHPTWAGDLFYPRYYTCLDDVLLKHPTLSFSHRV